MALAAAGVLSLTAGINARADYQSTVLGDGPLAYYRFSEASVVTVPNPVAANLGTLGAAANATEYTTLPESPIIKGVPGALADPADKACRFPDPGANNNHLVIPWQSGLAYNGPFSIEFWARPASDIFTSPGAMMKYWTSGSGCEDGNRYGWLIYQSDTDLDTGNGWQIRLYKGAGSSLGGIAQANMAITAGAWYHLVFVYTGSRVQMFVNGNKLDDQATSGFVAPPFSNYGMNFGSRGYSGSTSCWEYSGDLDEIVFYTNAVTADDVLTHYNSAATATSAQYGTMILTNSPAGYWRLNEVFTPPVTANLGSGGTALDATYRNWCTTTNDDQFVGPGYPGLETTNRTLFLATSQPGYARIPALGASLSSATFECVLKRNGEQSPWAGLVFSRNGNSTCGLDFNGNYSSLGGPLGYCWNNSASSLNWNSGLIPPNGQWTYVALAVTPSQATMYMYDGTTWSSAVNPVAHGAATFDAQMLVGDDNGATSRFFNGLVDEVAVYNKALTEGQLHNHALTAFGGLGAPVIVSGPTLTTTGDIFEGMTISMTVDAYGAPVLGYQWVYSTDFFTWTPIPGAPNSATFTKTAAQSDTGFYAVNVTNSAGVAHSYDIGGVAYVYVYPATPPEVTQDPQSRAVYPGGSCTFTAVASGPALHYQWKHAGTNLPGATLSALTVANVDASKTGSYQMIVTNLVDTATSLAATLSLLPVPANSYEAAVVADQPEAYWRLDETAGPTISDSMGRHDGTLSGAVTLSQEGVLGGGDANTCMNFAGGYVSVPYSAALNPMAFTVECWARLDDVPFPLTETDFYAPFASRDGNYDLGGIRKGYNLYADGGDGNWDFWVGRGPTWEYAQGTAVQTNAWTHFACTYDGTAARIYVNGVKGLDDYIVIWPNVRQPFTIGTILDSGPYPWHGPIDEVSFYGTALSASRINMHYQLGVNGSSTRPVFTTQPASQSVQGGSSVSFNPVVVGGTSMTYQWKKDGADVAGGNSLSLAFASVDYTNAGQFVLAVTNSFGGTVSEPATLVVNPPASVTNLTARITKAAVGIKFELIWPLGHTLYSTTNLAAPSWQPVIGASAPYYNVPIDTGAGEMFFKIE